MFWWVISIKMFAKPANNSNWGLGTIVRCYAIFEDKQMGLSDGQMPICQ